MTEFFVDIEDSSGNKLGGGPITSAAQWRYTARMDRAGEFEFTMPASDPKAFVVQKKRIARAFALINDEWVEVGAGIIDSISKQPRADGLTELHVSGNDLIAELSYRSVLNLTLYDGGLPVSHSAALTATSAYAPLGWSFTPDGSPPNDSVYGYFNGETVLAAMVKIADKSQNHFYRGVGRSLIFASDFVSSGVRAIQARGDLVSETCAVVSLTEQIDTYDLITRIYPRGSGNANVQLTLRATERNAPSGYTLNTNQNYIENDTATSEYGRIERQVDFRDIGPVANTDSDVVAASNMLFDAALEELRRRSEELEQATYTLQIAGCSQLLRPMQTIHLVYRDADADMDINEHLNILSATWEVGTSGIYTTDLVVSSADRWPPSDVGVIADSIAEGHVYQALPQLNANAYTTAYRANVDAGEVAEFRFRFGNEVTQLQQVLFEFQLLPFESTVLSVGTESGGSGDVPTSGPSSNSTGSGGNNDTGSGGPTSTESATPTIESATPDIGSATPTIGSSTPTIGSATPNIGNATPTIGTTTPTIGTTTPSIGSTTPSIGGTGLSTNTPTGGSTDGSGDHQHYINIIAGAGSLGEVSLHKSGGNYFLANPFITGSEPVYVSPVGFHTHTVTGHTHTIDPHTHTIASHTHTISGHTHTISGHTHTIAAHDHTIVAHTHSLPSHTHSQTGHSHTIAAHAHTISAHTHSMSSHIHSLNNHTHSLSGSIQAVYGIFRDDPDNVFEADELRYRVNGGSWLVVDDDAVDAGDGWWQLDITALVVNATTFRPLQTNNLLEIAGTEGIAISSFSTSGFDVEINTATNHNLEVGEPVIVENSVVGTSGVDVDGKYTVDTVSSTTNVRLMPWDGVSLNSGGAGGTITLNKRATIDAQLSVRNTIQAIAYV